MCTQYLYHIHQHIRCSTTDEWNKNIYKYILEFYLALKRAKSCCLQVNVKWSKPDWKSQRLQVCLPFTVLGSELKALCMLGKHTTSKGMCLVHLLVFCVWDRISLNLPVWLLTCDSPASSSSWVAGIIGLGYHSLFVRYFLKSFCLA
jgi:hypothetical protein